MSTRTECLQCGRTLPEPKPTGRERLYCNPACRKKYERAQKKKDKPLSNKDIRAALAALKKDIGIIYRGLELVFDELGFPK